MTESERIFAALKNNWKVTKVEGRNFTLESLAFPGVIWECDADVVPKVGQIIYIATKWILL